MKFATYAALISLASAACEKGGDNVCKNDMVCLYRKTEAVGKPNSSAYKQLLEGDATMALGSEKWDCVLDADANTLVAVSGQEGDGSVTFKYEVRDKDWVDPEAKSNAILIKGATLIATVLGVISYC